MCPEKFKNKKNLLQHMKMHEKELNNPILSSYPMNAFSFKCTSCQESFRTSEDMMNHLSQKHLSEEQRRGDGLAKYQSSHEFRKHDEKKKQFVPTEMVVVSTDRTDVTSIMICLQRSRKIKLLPVSGNKYHLGGSHITRGTMFRSHKNTIHKGPGPGGLRGTPPPPGASIQITASRDASV